MERTFLKKIIEGILFISSEPISIEAFKNLFDGEVTEYEIERGIRELQIEYASENRGIEIKESAGGFQFRTKPELKEWIKKLDVFKPQRLTRSAVETLAIIAYRQPVTKGEIDKIRGGIDSSGALKSLLDKKLIKISGRKRNAPGRPFLYVTTKKFLEVFSLQDLNDLPPIEELEGKIKKSGDEREDKPSFS